MESLREKRHRDEHIQVAEQAAAWLIALEENGTAEHEAFSAWLEESPLHVEMFLRATAVSRISELLGPADRAALAARVMSSVERSRVTTLGTSPSPAGIQRTVTTPASPHRGWRWRIAAAASLLLAIGAVVLWQEAQWDTYSTRVGEQRIVRLNDGSVVYVNTDTQIKVAYSDRGREVELARGEALFKVAHDPTRPFRVKTSNALVQALGTQFNVYRRTAATTVSVIEGSVQVSVDGTTSPLIPAAGSGSTRAAGAPPEIKRLMAGQSIQVMTGRPLAQPIAANVAQVTAWRERRLVFEWQTLEAIATEFNRYNRTLHIHVEGDDVRARRYTAVFDADSPQTLIGFLSRDPGLVFEQQGSDVVIKARQP